MPARRVRGVTQTQLLVEPWPRTVEHEQANAIPPARPTGGARRYGNVLKNDQMLAVAVDVMVWPQLPTQ
jgi:hypothetical protein